MIRIVLYNDYDICIIVLAVFIQLHYKGIVC